MDVFEIRLKILAAIKRLEQCQCLGEGLVQSLPSEPLLVGDLCIWDQAAHECEHAVAHCLFIEHDDVVLFGLVVPRAV